MQNENNNLECKKCIRCKKDLPFTDFHQKLSGNHNKLCKSCNITKINPEISKIYRDSHRCQHGKQTNKCRDCNGSSYCNHGKQRQNCLICHGSNVCIHSKLRFSCIDCDPATVLKKSITQKILSYALSNVKRDKFIPHLDCYLSFAVSHLEEYFENNFTWQNHGELWSMDHQIPLKYREGGITPTLEEQYERLHISNIQPVNIHYNRVKGSKRKD